MLSVSFRQNFPRFGSNINTNQKDEPDGKDKKMKKSYKDFDNRPKIIYFLIAAAGYLLSVMTLMGKTSPLAIAFIGGSTGTDCFAAFLGAAIGYLTGSGFVEAVPPLIASASVCVLRFFLCKSRSMGADIAIAVVSGSAVLFTNSISVQNPSELMTVAALSVVSGIACFAFTRFAKLGENGIRLAAINPSRLLPHAVTAVFLAAALSSLSYGIFNLGSIVCVLAAMLAVYRFRFAGGGAAGIICALGMALADNDLTACGLALGAGALTAAVIAPKGKLPIAAALNFTSAVALSLFGMDRGSLAFIANLAVGSVIFMILPLKDLLGIMGRDGSGQGAGGTPTEVFAGRLQLVGSTMGELKYAVEKTAEALEAGSNRDITNVYNSACDRVCKDCRFNMKCWGEEYNDSVRQMNGFLRNLRSGESITPGHFKGALGVRCQRKQQLADTINKKYEDYALAGQMQRRVKEMRGILTKQLENTEKLFNSISDEFGKSTVFNREAAAKTERLLERCGLTRPKAAVRISDGNMMIEAYGFGDVSCTAEELGDLLIETLEREFDLPCIIKFGDRARITAFERAEYGVKSAVCQLSRKKDSANGDFVTGCVDGSGCYYSIVSDGMGSGTRARIDSAFACGLLTKLLESGIEVEAAIELLNTSLMVKSSDESFATLDICKVDLYTGRTTIFKAGGADSFVKSGKTVTKIHGSSLPVGVAASPTISSHSFIVGEDDVIIMTSDGADLSEKWLEQAFTRDSGGNINDLVKTVAGAARFNCEKGREDDISIVALQIKK